MSQEPHDYYGPCDGMGRNGECAECRRVQFHLDAEAQFDAWLRGEDETMALSPRAQEELRVELIALEVSRRRLNEQCDKRISAIRALLVEPEPLDVDGGQSKPSEAAPPSKP